MKTRILLLVGAVLVFATVNWQIVSKERLRNGGQTVYLEIAPVDPRSLMQGDYMALDFRLAREISAAVSTEAPAHRTAVVLLDSRGVGHFSRFDNRASLQPGEVRFHFRLRGGQIWLGTNAFFFHEGDSARYRNARFGEFHVGESGEAMLVSLRDENLQPMPR